MYHPEVIPSPPGQQIEAARGTQIENNRTESEPINRVASVRINMARPQTIRRIDDGGRAAPRSVYADISFSCQASARRGYSEAARLFRRLWKKSHRATSQLSQTKSHLPFPPPGSPTSHWSRNALLINARHPHATSLKWCQLCPCNAIVPHPHDRDKIPRGIDLPHSHL